MLEAALSLMASPGLLHKEERPCQQVAAQPCWPKACPDCPLHKGGQWLLRPPHWVPFRVNKKGVLPFLMEAATLGKGLATSVLLAITPISKTYSLPEKNFQQETLL